MLVLAGLVFPYSTNTAYSINTRALRLVLLRFSTITMTKTSTAITSNKRCTMSGVSR